MMNSSTKFDVTFAELTQLLMQPCKDDIQSFWECAFKGIENELESLFVKKIGPTHTNSIFRARWFGAPHDIEKVFENPGDALGPPPEAKKSGRMSSNNQHVFYGAEEKETAIAEIRPPVGSYVAVGRFNVIKDVILFDVTKFDELYKHSELKITTNQYEFLTCLPNRVSFPIFPDNTHEYLMTQSLVCYIKSKFKNIHGIRYDSSQTGYRGNNIMLFESNFSVEKIQYQKCIVMPPTSWNDAPCDFSIRYQLNKKNTHTYNPTPTLQLTPDNIDVLRIESVQYSWKASPCKESR